MNQKSKRLLTRDHPRFDLIVLTAVILGCVCGAFAHFRDNRSPGANCVTGQVPERFSNLKPIHEAENQFCREIADDPSLVAIYGFASSPTHGRIVRIYDNKATYSYYEDNARYRELQLSERELKEFRSVIGQFDVRTQGPMIQNCVDMCEPYEFLNIQKDSGKRVFIFAPHSRPPAPLSALSELFINWNSYSAIKTRYYLESKFPEARVLLSDDRYRIQSVWKSGSDMRVLLLELGQPLNDGPSWRSFQDGNVDGKIEQPAGVHFLKNYKHDGCGRSMQLNHYAFESELGADEICVGVSEKEGLWRVGAKGEKRLASGEYSSPIVTRDQKWIIAAKGDADKPIWKSIVRVNAVSGKEFKVGLPAADCFYPSASVPVGNEILLVRCKQEHTEKKNNPSPDPPEYYLLDPETGKARLAKGEIRPIMHQRFRYLQATGNPGEFWAAIPDRVQNITEIGRYDPNRFIFRPVQTVPSITFYSNDFWVDEREGHIYIVYESQLLRLPLRPDK